jgi:uncharacterized protein (TIGR02391 family)
MNLQTEISTPLWLAVQRSYEAQAWSNAILDATQFLGDLIRSRTDLQSDGVALIGQALGGKAPRLRLNRLQTESEQSVQAGAEQLLRGLYQAIRNPRSHERIEDTKADADALIVFVDFLLRLIGHAHSALSVEDAAARVLDSDFVPSRRYAELIVGEIPTRQKLQVALTVFRRRSETEGTKLRPFFDAAFAVLAAEDQELLLDAISNELRDNKGESGLRSVLQLLPTELWERLSEPARLRSENRLISDLKDGRYSRTTARCLGGSLATWSVGFWPQFLLKREVLGVLTEKLRSLDREQLGYVVQFCFSSLEGLAPAPPPSLEKVVIAALKRGDAEVKNAMDGLMLFGRWTWSKDVDAALAAFQEAQSFADDDDDLPF